MLIPPYPCDESHSSILHQLEAVKGNPGGHLSEVSIKALSTLWGAVIDKNDMIWAIIFCKQEHDQTFLTSSWKPLVCHQKSPAYLSLLLIICLFFLF